MGKPEYLCVRLGEEGQWWRNEVQGSAVSVGLGVAQPGLLGGILPSIPLSWDVKMLLSSRCGEGTSHLAASGEKGGGKVRVTFALLSFSQTRSA